MIRGSIYMTITFFFVAVFGLFLKIGQVGTTAIWMTFMAYLSSFVFAAILTLKHGISFLKTRRFFVLFLRALFGTTATVLYVIALKYIPLVNATLLFNTTPLFVPIFCLLILKTKLSWKVWIAILIGFIGILFIIRPTPSSMGRPGDLIGLGSGIFLALAFTMVKILSDTEPIQRINFYFFGIGTVLMTPFLFFSHPVPGLDNWAWAAGTGVFFILCQIFLIKAYQCADPHEVGVFQYTSVVFAGFFDWIVWNKVPSILTFIGIVLVIIGGALAIWMNSSSSKK
ncbi:DMT family transporter [Simkania sp.]|uniref:DMT family transporter n=1 Tax=Simkania sp. TaxID=34094 RepID=UPI003B51C1A1